MAKLREAYLGIACGKKGVGKSYATLEMITDYIFRHRRKALILDVNDEFGDVKNDQSAKFVHVPTIPLEYIDAFTRHKNVEARRVVPYHSDGRKMTLDELAMALSKILDNYKNGLLLIEDINKFVSDNLPNDLVGSIVTQRHVSCDIITHYQTIGKMGHPKIWGNANFIRFHACEDNVVRHKRKFEGNEEILFITEALVNNEYEKGNKYFYAYIMKEEGVIKGDFTVQQFDEAIMKMIENDYGKLEKEKKRRNVKTGKPIHSTHESALNYILNYYKNKYYGNPDYVRRHT